MSLTQYDRSWRAVAMTLAFVAGFTDVQGFLAAGGYFVSFMSGNSTRFGVAIGDGVSNAWTLAALLLCFVVGVALGSIGDAFGPRRRRTVVLLLASLLLAVAATLQSPKHGFVDIAMMALAMGTLNAVFVADNEVHVALTYMTGTLVKLGRHLGERVRGGPTKPWLPYAYHWLSLVGGGVMGTLAVRHQIPHALWIAAVIAAATAGVVDYLTRIEMR